MPTPDWVAISFSVAAGRIADAPAEGYDRASPTMGQDNDWVLGDLLGLSAEEQARLKDAGVVE